jgi:hypothetical protein
MENGQTRIDEITSENLFIIGLHKIPITYEIEFKLIIDDLDMFLHLKGNRLRDFILSKVEPFKIDLNNFLRIQFYDEADPDIVNIKNRYREMISIIDNKIKTGIK